METITLEEILKRIEEDEINLGILNNPCVGYSIVLHNNLIPPADMDDMTFVDGFTFDYNQRVLESCVETKDLVARLAFHHKDQLEKNQIEHAEDLLKTTKPTIQ